MSSAWSPPRTADELPDDDDEAINVLSGQLHDGNEIGRRERKLWPERHCPPWMKTDAKMTERFHRAVRHWDKELLETMADEGIRHEPRSLAEITENEIVGALSALAADKRRPAVQLGALTRLAEMKGLLKNKDRGPVTDDKLEAALDELSERSSHAVPD